MKEMLNTENKIYVVCIKSQVFSGVSETIPIINDKNMNSCHSKQKKV